MFFEDAKEASGILNVALTKRNGVPMCGVPYHAAEGYMAKLIKAGKRAAICDQIGEPQPGRIVQRRGHADHQPRHGQRPEPARREAEQLPRGDF